MSERNVLLLLYDIRASILKIYEYTNGMEFVDYIKDSKSREAIERNFEIIGEAASNIPDDFKKLNSQISWRIIKDFRNYLIHAYFGIDNTVSTPKCPLCEKVTPVFRECIKKQDNVTQVFQAWVNNTTIQLGLPAEATAEAGFNP